LYARRDLGGEIEKEKKKREREEREKKKFSTPLVGGFAAAK